MAGKSRETLCTLCCHFLLLMSLFAPSTRASADEFLMDEIVVQLSDDDLNSIKSSNLCSSGLGGEDC